MHQFKVRFLKFWGCQCWFCFALNCLFSDFISVKFNTVPGLFFLLFFTLSMFLSLNFFFQKCSWIDDKVHRQFLDINWAITYHKSKHTVSFCRDCSQIFLFNYDVQNFKGFCWSFLNQLKILSENLKMFLIVNLNKFFCFIWNSKRCVIEIFFLKALLFRIGCEIFWGSL